MARPFCALVFVSVVFTTIHCQNVGNTYSRYSRPVSSVANPQDVSQLHRRISILERDAVSLKRKNIQLEAMFRQMNATLFSMIAALNTTQQSTVANLTLRMDAVEANIDTIADQAGIDLEDTKLSHFLGNTEAQLVDLQLDPSFEGEEIPTIPPETEDFTEDQADLLGNALLALNKKNEMLSSQVAELQQEVSRDHSSTTSVRQTDMLEGRINQLERIFVSQTANVNHHVSASRGGKSGPLLQTGQAVQTAPLTDEEQEDFQNILQNTPGGAVSMFSFARTGSFVGTSGVPQSIPYERQLAAKGVVFDGTNGTFTCQVPGYYFITFTARTFDHKYLGVNLMKNQDSLTAIFSDKHGRNVMQTQSIIVHLGVGDHLWLRMPPSNKFAMHSDQYHLTTFTGFLLYQGEL